MQLSDAQFLAKKLSYQLRNDSIWTNIKALHEASESFIGLVLETLNSQANTEQNKTNALPYIKRIILALCRCTRNRISK